MQWNIVIKGFELDIKRCSEGFRVHPADKTALLEPNMLARDTTNIQYLEQVMSQNVYYKLVGLQQVLHIWCFANKTAVEPKKVYKNEVRQFCFTKSSKMR